MLIYKNSPYAQKGMPPRTSALQDRLPFGWHKPEQGGFDGRWVSLFDN